MKVFSAERFNQHADESTKAYIRRTLGDGWAEKLDGMPLQGGNRLTTGGKSRWGSFEYILTVPEAWTKEEQPLTKEVQEWKNKYYQLKAKLAFIQQVLDSKDGVIDHE